MKLNLIEKAVVNNPIRALIQRRYEARLLERMGGRTVPPAPRPNTEEIESASDRAGIFSGMLFKVKTKS